MAKINILDSYKKQFADTTKVTMWVYCINVVPLL